MQRKRTLRPADTRVISLLGHRASGKTTLGDRMLHVAGVTRSPGSVDDRTSLLDFRPDERARRASVEPSLAWLLWDGARIELVDLPGSDATPGRSAALLHATDGRVVVIDRSRALPAAVARALASRRPAMVVLSHLDRPADPELSDRVAAACGRPTPVLTLPMEDETGALVGVLDVLGKQAIRYADDESGAHSVEPLSLGDAGAAARARGVLEEAVALTDDALLERYLEDLTLGDGDLRHGLVAAVRSGQLVPIVHAAAPRGIGVESLLDLVVELLPPASSWPQSIDLDGAPIHAPPSGTVAQWVCTLHDADGAEVRIVRMWTEGRGEATWRHAEQGPTRAPRLYDLRGKRRSNGTGRLLGTWDPLPGEPGDTFTTGPTVRIVEGGLPPALVERAVVGDDGRPPEPYLQQRLRHEAEQAPGVTLLEHSTTGALLIRGLTVAQVERTVELVASGLRTTEPPLAWADAPAGPALQVCGEHREADDVGLPVAFGQCIIDLQPAAGAVVEVAVAPGIDPEDLPPRFLRPIEEGVRAGLSRGLAGHPVLGVRVTIQDGRYDMLQSTEEHFELAGKDAVCKALSRAGTRLLEPWYRVSLSVDAESVSELISALSALRGQLTGVETRDAHVAVISEIPAASWGELTRRLLLSNIVVHSANRRSSTPRPSAGRLAAR